MNVRLELPAPSPEEAAHAARVRAHLDAALASAGGWLPFAAFQERLLYAPGLGYYSAGARKLGADGDFVTAPEISPAFGACLATQCAETLAATGGGDLLELGAGTGRLAYDVLAALATAGAPPGRYRILEVSADLRERQRTLLATLPPALAARVEWLDAPPAAPWRGVLLANEVLDALPVERFRRTADGVDCLGVERATADAAAATDGRGAWRLAARPAPPALAAAVAALEAELGAPFPPGYVHELRPVLGPWLAAVTAGLERGLALFVDYGLPRRSLYAPDRDGGTLACFRRHRRHDDPFAFPGLQDVTAWVDFTAVAEAGLAAGLEVAGYTTQAHFLLATGLDAHLAALAVDDPLAGHRAAKLVLPGEMGERFKVLGLARGLAGTPRGFRLRDLVPTL